MISCEKKISLPKLFLHHFPYLLIQSPNHRLLFLLLYQIRVMQKMPLKVIFGILLLHAMSLLSTCPKCRQAHSEENKIGRRLWFKMDNKGNVWHSSDCKSWVQVAKLLPRAVRKTASNSMENEQILLIEE